MAYNREKQKNKYGRTISPTDKYDLFPNILILEK